MNKNYIWGGVAAVVVILLIVVLMNKPNTNAVSDYGTTPSPSTTVTAAESVSPAASPASTVSPAVKASVGVTVNTAPVVTVLYTASGFSPKTITINKGDTVRFVNQTSGRMSVASDPHPTHTNYPEFDQYKTAARGASTFDFTFEKTGTWGYHNHLQASDTGTVIVK